MSENNEETLEHPLLPSLLHLKAEIETLHHAVVFLCVAVVPPDSLFRYMEQIGSSIDIEGGKTAEAIQSARTRFIGELKKNLAVPQDKGLG